MEKLFKTLLVCFSLLVIISISSTALAVTRTGSSLGHKNDKWQYGVQLSLTDFSKRKQYSYFTCQNKYHTATAIVGVSNNGKITYYKDFDSKSAKKQAKADTLYYANVVEWNSYYNHP